jgi:hypothetical protein
LTAANDVLDALKTHEALVKNETLTLEISYIESASLSGAVAVGDNQQVQISVVKL